MRNLGAGSASSAEGLAPLLPRLALPIAFISHSKPFGNFARPVWWPLLMASDDDPRNLLDERGSSCPSSLPLSSSASAEHWHYIQIRRGEGAGAGLKARGQRKALPLAK